MKPYRKKLTLPEINFRTSQLFVDMLSELGAATATQGSSLRWQSCFPSQAAYYVAASRLRRKGLVTSQSVGGKTPRLTLTPGGAARISPALRPERFWRRKWNGYWYILSYDVPETERNYRKTLQRFLSRMRMGCLQRSVWISPDNIRTTFHDLMDAAAIEDFGVLLKCKEIIGRSSEQVVCDAWPLDELEELHTWYCEHCEEQIQRIKQDSISSDALIALAKTELQTYLRVMFNDPLLPRKLWPQCYRGEEVLGLYRTLTREIREHL